MGLPMRSALGILLVLSAAAQGAKQSAWDSFRGPAGSGVADGAKLPAEAGPKTNVVWKSAMPPGHSSPVIAGGVLYVTAAEGGKLLTVALDTATGKERWRRGAPRSRVTKVRAKNTEASPTP